MTTDSETSRRLATQFYTLLSSQKYDDLLSLTTPTATWWIAGPSSSSSSTLPLPLSLFGTHPLADRIQHMKAAFGAAKCIKYEIREITAEGGVAIVESYTKAEGPGEGQVYENENLTKFRVRDGKIESVREYLDSSAILKYMAAAEVEAAA